MLIDTHYVPAFTRSVVAAGHTILERAACGTYVAWDEIAPAETEPSCGVCRDYCITPLKEGAHATDPENSGVK